MQFVPCTSQVRRCQPERQILSPRCWPHACVEHAGVCDHFVNEFKHSQRDREETPIGGGQYPGFECRPGDAYASRPERRFTKTSDGF